MEKFQTNELFDENKYLECLKTAHPKKLCPEGYCTAKLKFTVYPSAYANGYAAQVCNGSKPNYLGTYKNSYQDQDKNIDSDLTRWYNEKWVDVCDPNLPPCGRKKASLDPKDYPYCRPLYKLEGTPVKSYGELTKQEISKMCKVKKSIEQGIKGKPSRIYLKNEL